MTPARTRSPGLTFAEVLSRARVLPGVEESTSYGTPAIKVRGVLLARLREDGATLVLRTPHVVRDDLMRAAPGVFFLEDHYRDYPWTLVRLGAADGQQIQLLLEDAWRAAAPRRLVTEYDRARSPARGRTGGR